MWILGRGCTFQVQAVFRSSLLLLSEAIWSSLQVCSLQGYQTGMLFQPFCGSLTSRGSLLSFWRVCCSAACPSWDGTLSLAELWASPICFPTDQAFYCQLLDMNFSPSALNQVSPLLQCNLLFFMVSPTQEEPELGVGMGAVPGRTLQTLNFLTHSLVFGDKFFSICCIAFG